MSKRKDPSQDADAPTDPSTTEKQSETKQPAPPEVGSWAKMERNIEKWPLFPLYRDENTLRAITTDGTTIYAFESRDGDQVWQVEVHSSSSMPGPVGNDLWVALCKLYNDARNPVDRTIRTTLVELASLLGVPKGGETWRILRQTLTILENIKIVGRNTFRRAGERRLRTETWRLFEKTATEESLDNPNADKLFEIRFSSDVVNSLDKGMFRLLDFDTYRSLGTPTARRLYRYLDQARWRGLDCLAEMTMPLQELQIHIPVGGESPSDLKRTLNRAHQELVAGGVLSSWKWEKVGKHRGVKAWEVRYVFQDAQTTLPLQSSSDSSRRTSSDDSIEPAAELVDEIVETLDDEKSRAFFMKVCRVLPEDTVRGILGDAKQMLNAVPIEVVRKSFTIRAQERARDMNLDL